MHHKRFYAFTLVEMLVVIAIIAVLSALFMPQLLNALHSARLMACQSGQRQLGMAILQYADANRGFGPADTHNNEANFWAADNFKGYFIPENQNLNTVVDLAVCPETDTLWRNGSNKTYRAGGYTSYPLGNSATALSSTYLLVFGTGNRTPLQSKYWYGWNAGLLDNGTCPVVPSLHALGRTYSVGTKTMQVRTASTQPMLSDLSSPLGDFIRPRDFGAGQIRAPHSGGTNTVFIDGHANYTPWFDFNDEIRFYYSEASVRW